MARNPEPGKTEDLNFHRHASPPPHHPGAKYHFKTPESCRASTVFPSLSSPHPPQKAGGAPRVPEGEPPRLTARLPHQPPPLPHSRPLPRPQAGGQRACALRRASPFRPLPARPGPWAPPSGPRGERRRKEGRGPASGLHFTLATAGRRSRRCRGRRGPARAGAFRVPACSVSFPSLWVRAQQEEARPASGGGAVRVPPLALRELPSLWLRGRGEGGVPVPV